eukprot:14410797-Alexandrium_andersonii.AAC.1
MPKSAQPHVLVFGSNAKRSARRPCSATAAEDASSRESGRRAGHSYALREHCHPSVRVAQPSYVF